MSWAFAQWQRLRHGLWFRPGLIAIMLLLLGLFMPMVDRQVWAKGLPAVFGAAPETARALLATIAGSLMTVLALVFSLTLIAMQLVSSQLTPRALRDFLGASVTQTAAGTFIGTIVYCFLVMRSVRSPPNASADTPELSVTLGLALGVFAMGILLLFVNHIATWMHLSSIVERIFSSTLKTMERHYPRLSDAAPEGDGDAGPSAPTADERSPGGSSVVVTAARSGFVQYYTIEQKRLPKATRELTILVGTGTFIHEGQKILEATVDGEISQTLHEALREVVVIGNERDIAQDVAFGLRQLADIALRALSPGVNDPTTAVTCIHYLTDCLRRLGRRRLGHQVRRVDGHNIAFPTPTFDEYLALAFDEIAHFGIAQPRIVVELTSALDSIEQTVSDEGALSRVRSVRRLRRRIVGQALNRGAANSEALKQVDEGQSLELSVPMKQFGMATTEAARRG